MRIVTLTKGDTFEPKKVLLEIIKLPVGGAVSGKGVTVEDMRNDIRLLDVFDAVDGDAPVEIEDADWQHLCRKVRAFPFAFSSKEIVRLCDEVLSAPEKEKA